MLKLSILDQSTAATDQDEGQSIRDTILLAQLSEQLDYNRFWVSEHHNHPTIVGSAPEIIMAAIGQATTRIRIGSAGVMLPHYAPLKVAEQFRVLESIAPGRIDLGIGRAPGSDGKTAYALNPSAHTDAEHFPANVRDLMAWVSGQQLIKGHPFNGLKAHPVGETSPEVWMLGTSAYGAQIAAHYGIPYCFAHFITDGRGVKQALDLYRESFSPSERYPKPKPNVCVWALAGETEAEAFRIFSSRAHWKIKRDQGILGKIESPEKLAQEKYSKTEKKQLEDLQQSSIVGSSEQVKSKLHNLSNEYGVEEISILTWTHDQNDKRRSYELIAEAYKE